MRKRPEPSERRWLLLQPGGDDKRALPPCPVQFGAETAEQSAQLALQAQQQLGQGVDVPVLGAPGAEAQAKGRAALPDGGAEPDLAGALRCFADSHCLFVRIPTPQDLVEHSPV